MTGAAGLLTPCATSAVRSSTAVTSASWSARSRPSCRAVRGDPLLDLRCRVAHTANLAARAHDVLPWTDDRDRRSRKDPTAGRGREEGRRAVRRGHRARADRAGPGEAGQRPVRDLGAELFGTTSAGTSGSSGPDRTLCSRTGRTRRTASSPTTTSSSATSARSSPRGRPTSAARSCSATTRSSTGSPPTCRGSSPPGRESSTPTPTSPASSCSPHVQASRGRRLGVRRRTPATWSASSRTSRSTATT